MSETPAEFWSNVCLIFQWFELDRRDPVRGRGVSVPTARAAKTSQATSRSTHDPGPQEGQVQSLQYGELPPEY